MNQSKDPLSLKLKQELKKVFGYESFRFEQEKIIQHLIAGKDSLVIMPTGGGKSLCYQLPALVMEGTALVISPLIALMQDQVKNLQQNGVDAEFLNSSLSFEERLAIEQKVKSGKVKLLYMAPEGILSPNSFNFFQQLKVSLIAIDEAHCVSQWGHEFRKDYTRLNELKAIFPDTPTIALTATANAKTRTDICDQLALQQPDIFLSTFDRPNIKYTIYERENEIKQLNEFIQKHHAEDTGIVYCLSRNKVESVSEKLQELGYKAIPYHAGLSSKVRQKHQQRFDLEEKIIVVATIAFGMGIDRPDVRFVAHLDLPKSLEGYYQETGRAGRDGKAANAWMVYGLADIVKLSQMLENSEANEEYKQFARRKLDSMLSFCESTICRREELLRYFGEEKQNCNNCDTCLEPQEMWDATVETQKVLSTIYRTRQFYGSTYIIDVLRGSKNAKILENGHDKLSVFGIGKEISKKKWNSILRQLLHLGYIRIKNWDYRNLALTQASAAVLQGKTQIQLRKLSEKESFSETKRNNRKEKSKTKTISQEHDRPELYEQLRSLRLKIAREESLPPYMIFSDKSLHDMCALLPQKPDDFLLVHGVGQNKLSKYGEKFLSEISAYLEK